MRLSKWFPLLSASLVIAMAANTGCKRDNGINNEQVIRTPHSLFFSDSIGTLFNTNGNLNKGSLIVRTAFQGDGTEIRSFVTTGPIIVEVKRNVHRSDDDAQNFNPTDSTANLLAHGPTALVNYPSQMRMYLLSIAGRSLKYSDNQGLTWTKETAFDTAITNNYIPFMVSLTMLGNGEMYARDDFNSILYKKPNKTADWNVVSSLDTIRGHYFLGRINNTLIMADRDDTNTNGKRILFSNNGGQSWTPYSGVPNNRKIYTVDAPFGQGLLAGFANVGIYR